MPLDLEPKISFRKYIVYLIPAGVLLSLSMFGSINRLFEEPGWFDYTLVTSGVLLIIGSAIYYAKQNRVYQIEFYASDDDSFKNQVKAIVTTRGFHQVEADEYSIIYKPNVAKASESLTKFRLITNGNYYKLIGPKFLIEHVQSRFIFFKYPGVKQVNELIIVRR